MGILWSRSFSCFFASKLVETKEKGIAQHIFSTRKKQKEKNRSPRIDVPSMRLNAMPFQTEARKCNHWATGFLNRVAKFLCVHAMHSCY